MSILAAALEEAWTILLSTIVVFVASVTGRRLTPARVLDAMGDVVGTTVVVAGGDGSAAVVDLLAARVFDLVFRCCLVAVIFVWFDRKYISNLVSAQFEVTFNSFIARELN